MTSFFEGAHNLKFSGSQSFTSANSITYNYHTLLESGHESSGLRNDESWLTLPGGKQRLRVVDICDVIVLKQISSETRTFHTLAKPPLSKPKNPSIARLERQRGSVKIRKEVQTAEIVQFGNRRFTVVSFKPEHQDDSEKIRKVLHPLCEAALSSRQAQLTQIFGVGRTTAPTLIYHDEFVNGWDIVDRYYEEAIVHQSLWLRFRAATIAAEDCHVLKQLGIPVSYSSRDWTFNLKNGSFQYDIVSNAYTQANTPTNRLCSTNDVFEFPPFCNPLLDSSKVISVIPNFLHLVSGTGRIYAKGSTDFVRHDVLTFGALVHRTRPGILGYFPSVPCPAWNHLSRRTSDVDVKYSQSGEFSFEYASLTNTSDLVPSLLHLTFKKKTNIRMDIEFSLRMSLDDCQHYQASYMIQSFLFYNSRAELDDLVFTDEIRFHLRGTFVSDRTTSHSPVYLHVPPLSPEWINSMPCLRCPSISTLFYWSSDPLGLIKIPETDWEAYGIPNLRVDTYLACSWLSSSYFAVWDYLRLKNYDLDGEQFATQHGYSHLIKGDPHVQFETYPSPGPDNFLTLIEWVKTPDMRRAVSGPLHRMSYG